MKRENENQQTVILKWNPSISSYKMDQFEEELDLIDDGFIIDDANWSVWEYDKAKNGDKFYMLKVGPGVNGIVMCGVLTSEPYQCEDWSGKGRTVYYMDMGITEMIHPDRCPILTSEELAKAIPDFDWNGGHSGVVLTQEQAQKLNALWKIYLEKHTEIFLPRAAKCDISDYLDEL